MKPISLQLAAGLAALFGLGSGTACAQQPQDSSAEAPLPTLIFPGDDNGGNWLDAPQTPGDWTYRAVGGESFAEFQSPAGKMVFQLNCTGEREIFLAVAAPGLHEGSITIRTETQSRMLNAAAREGWRVAALRPADPLLDAMAITKGRFAVEVDGTEALYLPAWAEVTRVIEDCR
ncbi:MAG TPA: hypothetical protein VFX62_05945 [Erythrobacter sp.]|nr:hypothetical protein [Erythrobacter sp.]